MLEITPIHATEERLIAAKATGAQYLEDTLAYVAFLNGKVIALCQFRVSSDNAEITAHNIIFQKIFSLAANIACKSSKFTVEEIHS